MRGPLRTRFTLVELMISVAVVATLTAIAIPSVHRATLRAKRAEVDIVVAGIEDSFSAYWVAYSNFDDPPTWPYAEPNPPGAYGASARPWVADTPGWSELGFTPDGVLRGSYRIDAFLLPRVVGRSDVDEDLTVGAEGSCGYGVYSHWDHEASAFTGSWSSRGCDSGYFWCMIADGRGHECF